VRNLRLSSESGRIIIWLLVSACFGILVTGCTSAKLTRARDQFYAGKPAEAAGTLGAPEDYARRDRLLYFMEKGVILHEAGAYAESVQALLDAAEFIVQEEILSVSREGTSLVTSERITVYRGEYAERLFIHSYLMMNYLLLDQPDDAYVEARRALQVLAEYPDACSGDYFTRGLIAHCFEAVGEINGAYIEYRKLAGDMPDPAPVLPKVYQLARQLGFDDDAARYADMLPEAERQVLSSPAEAVMFISQGKGPVKEPRNIVLPPSIRFSFVQYRERGSRYFPPGVESTRGRLRASGVTTDVAAVLKTSLNVRAARIMVKETSRATAKEVISNQFEDPMAEALVRIAFFLMEEPDTRGWETLPGYLTLTRVPLDRGVHALTVTDAYGTAISLSPVGVSHKRKYFYFSVRLGDR